MLAHPTGYEKCWAKEMWLFTGVVVEKKAQGGSQSQLYVKERGRKESVALLFKYEASRKAPILRRNATWLCLNRWRNLFGNSQIANGFMSYFKLLLLHSYHILPLPTTIYAVCAAPYFEVSTTTIYCCMTLSQQSAFRFKPYLLGSVLAQHQKNNQRLYWAAAPVFSDPWIFLMSTCIFSRVVYLYFPWSFLNVSRPLHDDAVR